MQIFGASYQTPMGRKGLQRSLPPKPSPQLHFSSNSQRAVDSVVGYRNPNSIPVLASGYYDVQVFLTSITSLNLRLYRLIQCLLPVQNITQIRSMSSQYVN